MTLNKIQKLAAEIFRNLFAEEFAAHSPPDPENHPAAGLEFLNRLNNDVLSAEERAEFLRHLERCPFCRHEIAFFIRSGILYAEPESEPIARKGIEKNLSAADGRAESGPVPDSGNRSTEDVLSKGSASRTLRDESISEAYQEAVRAAPDDPNLRLDYARYQLNILDRPVDACETLKELPEDKSAANRVQFLMTFGIALSKIGDDAGAQKKFRQAVELDPASIDARLNLAVSLCRTGGTNEAIELFESVKNTPSLDEDLRRRVKSLIDALKE